jgi:NAD(P)-dependent dehydrogenase (short-subunit alcohol dehydrogenase family)
LALAKQASARGYNLILADINEDCLENAKKILNLDPTLIKTKVCDVSKENEIRELADFSFAQFGESQLSYVRHIIFSISLGGVHLLCNNAGVGLAKLSWEHTTSDWNWVLGVNMWSIVHANRYFIPRMLKQSDRSRILNTASAAGLLSTPGMMAYNVSKHAVVTMSETLYHELKDINANVSHLTISSFDTSDYPPQIDVSVLCPAFIPTGIAKSERNRPPDTLNNVTDTEAAMENELFQQANAKYGLGLLKAVKAGKKSADDVAVEVFEAMDRNDFYIVPHKKILAAVGVRSEDIVKLRQPTLMPTA